MMSNYKYQYGCSDQHFGVLYSEERGKQKANKILAVINDYLKGRTGTLILLDIGCSTGMITNLIGRGYYKVVGIDIDESAVRFAQQNYSSVKQKFLVADAMNLKFFNNSFDVVVCNHIYEHVPDSRRLLEEIYRVLKPGGICYFSAANRWVLIEPHYRLPFLSLLPKWLAHPYLRLFKKGGYYYENHLTARQLLKLVSSFRIIDYTQKVIDQPEKYSFEKMIKQDSLKQRLVSFLIKHVYKLCPIYIWLLIKK